VFHPAADDAPIGNQTIGCSLAARFDRWSLLVKGVNDPIRVIEIERWDWLGHTRLVSQ
jgi:hypothetical protein